MRISLHERQQSNKKRRGKTYHAAVTTAWKTPTRRSSALPAASRRLEASAADRRAVTRRSAAPDPAPSGARVLPARELVRSLLRWLVPFRWIALLLSVALTAVMAYCFADERFFVYEAQILGAAHIDTAAIYDAAGIHELNIFWVKPGRVAEHIRQLDGIKSVQVLCRLPAQVTIKVEEREPLILWRATGQERDWWLDDEGMVLPYHGDPRSGGVHFVVDLSPRQFAPGILVEPVGIVDSVLKLASALPEAELFYFEEGKGLSYTARSGQHHWTVYVGSSQDLDLKIRALATITDHLVAQNIEPLHVDVRWPKYPVYALPEGHQVGNEN